MERSEKRERMSPCQASPHVEWHASFHTAHGLEKALRVIVQMRCIKKENGHCKQQAKNIKQNCGGRDCGTLQKMHSA